MNIPLSAVVAAWLASVKAAEARVALDQLQVLDGVVRHVPEIRQVLLAPTISRDQKLSLLKKSGFAVSIQKLVGFIDASRMWSSLSKIVAETARFVSTQHNITPATVRSAVGLTDREQKQLVTALEKRSKASIELQQIVEPDLIGGMIIDVAGDRIDLSIRGKLNRLKRAVSSLA